jgi:hypothetical protein
MNLRPFLRQFAIAWNLAVIAPAASEAPDVPRLDPFPKASESEMANLEWHDVSLWGVEGRAFTDMKRLRWFDRLPAAAEKSVKPTVWQMSRDSAGMMVRFKTDAAAIFVHYRLMKEKLNRSHMPATGVSGVDLYARDAAGRWCWVGVTRPSAQEIKVPLITGLAPGFREFAAYLPLLNGVESLAIGVPKGVKFERLPPRSKPKPIVFYGTSITHGGCASRPGMAHTAILGRRFDWPVVNLGFSDNGRMDAAVGDLLVLVDAAVYVIDCLPNMKPADVAEKCAPLVRQMRAARPDTPIILVEDRRYTNSWITPTRAKFHDDNHAALRAAYATLRQEGIGDLHYIAGDRLYGDDTEGATDGSHASDLGFMRQADAMEPVLRAVLQRP